MEAWVIVPLILIGAYLGIGYALSHIDSAPTLWPFKGKR